MYAKYREIDDIKIGVCCFHRKFVKLVIQKNSITSTVTFTKNSWNCRWKKNTLFSRIFFDNELVIEIESQNPKMIIDQTLTQIRWISFSFSFFFFCLSTIINCVLRISSRKISCVVWRIHDVIKKGYKRQKIVHHVTEKHSNRIP